MQPGCDSPAVSYPDGAVSMVKFAVIFLKPADPAAFENAYNDFLALAERMPYIVRRQVVDVLGSPTGISPYHRILEIYFNDQAQMEAGLRSGQGQEAGAELRKRFPARSFEVLYADVYEEAGAG